MILSIIALLLVAGIAYFHWVQGLFSAAISMTLAILAAALAVGMHEAVAASLLGGALPDYANTMMLCAIFAAVYGIGRLVFDALVPGNVSLPFYMDKVGGGICGLIAGIFAVGTVVLGAQMLPFGLTIAGFTRYDLADTKEVTVPGRGRAADADVSGALQIEGGATRPEATAQNKLIIPVDSMVLNFVSFQSDTGALAGDVALADRHPDLLNELFFARGGIEPGAKRSAMNIAGKKDVSVTKVMMAPTLVQVDAELGGIRHPGFNVEKQLKAGPNSILLVVRANVSVNASDKDKKFRFSTGAVRLVVDGADHYPVGTLYHPGNVLLANRIDDYLVADVGADGEIDFVFVLDRAAILEEPDAKTGLKVKADAFIEVKRYARVDLGGMEIAPALDSAAKSSVIRKLGVVEEITKRLSGAAVEENAN